MAEPDVIYLDHNATTPLLPEVVGCGREPEFVRLHSDLPDLRVSDLFEVGARLPIDSLTLFYRDGKACKGFSPDPSNNYHVVGKRLDLAIIKQSVE